MNNQHPSDSDWMLLLYGELAEEQAAELDQHLASCPECAEHVRGWRSTMTQLDEWQLEAPVVSTASSPPTAGRSSVTLTRILATSVAAVAAFLGGIWVQAAAGPSSDELKAELRQDFDDFRAELLSVSAPVGSDPIPDVSQALADWEEQSTDREQKLRRMLNEVLRNQLTLREDLETLALEAESQILRTRAELARLRSGSVSPVPPLRNPL